MSGRSRVECETVGEGRGLVAGAGDSTCMCGCRLVTARKPSYPTLAHRTFSCPHFTNYYPAYRCSERARVYCACQSYHYGCRSLQLTAPPTHHTTNPTTSHQHLPPTHPPSTPPSTHHQPTHHSHLLQPTLRVNRQHLRPQHAQWPAVKHLGICANNISWLMVSTHRVDAVTKFATSSILRSFAPIS